MYGEDEGKKKSFVLRCLDGIEVVGNRLPPPMMIFIFLAAAIIVISGIGTALGWSATGEVYNTKSMQIEETTINIM